MTAGVYNEITLNVKGIEIKLLDDGFMKDRDLWNRDVALKLAEREDLTLTDEHWELLDFLRDYYSEFMISPNVKILVKHLRETSGDKTMDTKQLYSLFPKGPSFQGCKIAGLPKPTNCIDG